MRWVALALGVQVHQLGNELLVFVPGDPTQDVASAAFRLTGDAATVAGLAADGPVPVPHHLIKAATELEVAGICTLQPGTLSRRHMLLAAAGAGIATVALPDAAQAASPTDYVPTPSEFTDGETTYLYWEFMASGELFIPTGKALAAVDFLVVAGGGAGGSGSGGGGGAGGILTTLGTSSNASQISLAAGRHTITVGDGGQGVLDNFGGNGGNSGIDAVVVAVGGGGGGGSGPGLQVLPANRSGKDGGSGGGASLKGTGVEVGKGTAGPPRQGYDGGQGVGDINKDQERGGGGGGGWGGLGGNGSGNTGGTGGTGETVDLVAGAAGTPQYTVGGGGGGAGKSGAGTATFGGGNGAAGPGLAGASATAHSGGGGGGGGARTSDTDPYGRGIGGNGGSGLVVLRAVEPPA